MDIPKLLDDLRGLTGYKTMEIAQKYNLTSKPKTVYLNEKAVNELVEYFKGNSILQEYIQKKCFGLEVIIDNTLKDNEYKIGVE